jgi:prepilin-type N-terminal cleavage/methylation domain-containing protein
MKNNGFTFIEIIVVLGIIGIIIAASFPSILNVMETRVLDSSSRDVLTTLEAARYLAVNDKVNCRVRFFEENEVWRYLVEVEETPNTWSAVHKFIKKSLPKKFNPQVQLPASTQSIIFSPLGMIANYDFNSPQNHRIVLQSLKLKKFGQEDLRIITIYAGGSIGYRKAKS